MLENDLCNLLDVELHSQDCNCAHTSISGW